MVFEGLENEADVVHGSVNGNDNSFNFESKSASRGLETKLFPVIDSTHVDYLPLYALSPTQKNVSLVVLYNVSTKTNTDDV